MFLYLREKKSRGRNDVNANSALSFGAMCFQMF